MGAASSRAKSAAIPRQDDHELRNYRLEERIGQDELSTLYRAQHLTLERPVEVYILRRSDWVSVSRFQQAAKLAARLKHPQIIPVLDAGHDDRYGYYMVTPPIGGRLLQDVLDEGRLPISDAIRIFSDIARALDYLHEEHVVHRDIQPGSIMVVERSSETGIMRQAYLANLSLAWSADGPDLSELEEADYLTAYAAPEQDFQHSEPHSTLDIYALGAVLYHMLTNEVPPPPGQAPRALSEIDPELASADRILRRLLSPQAQLRYSAAGQAAAALRQALREVIMTEPIATGVEAETTGSSAHAIEHEWLENPVETVLSSYIEQDFIQRSREWARALQQPHALRRLLNDWSRKNILRKRNLGNVLVADQVISYDFYTYEIRAYYETRTAPEPREKSYQGSRLSDRHSPPGVWQIPLPDPKPFDEIRPQEMTVPHSERVEMCSYCGGRGDINCNRCHGRGLIEDRQMVTNPDGSREKRTVTSDCPDCTGEGQNDCVRCKGSGQLLTEDVFMWSRWGKLWDNTDDETGLPLQDIRSCSEIVYSSQINVRDQHWHAIAPLHELLQAAEQVDEEQQTRILHAELTIRGTTVTEIDYQERNKPRTLYLIGNNPPMIRSDFSVYDWERIGLYGVVAMCLLILIIVLL